MLNLREGKPAGFKAKELGTVKGNEATDLGNLLGRNVSGYSRSVEADRLLHIDARHGIDGKENTNMVNANDVARMQYVLDNYDSIEVPMGSDGRPKMSEQYKDSSGEPCPIVNYKKRVNGQCH